jgi:hypothetical protein
MPVEPVIWTVDIDPEMNGSRKGELVAPACLAHGGVGGEG